MQKCPQTRYPDPKPTTLMSARRSSTASLPSLIPGRPPFAQRDLGLEDLAVEVLRGAAENGRLEHFKPPQNITENVGHFVPSA
jgi:hypothetical protein